LNIIQENIYLSCVANNFKSVFVSKFSKNLLFAHRTFCPESHPSHFSVFFYLFALTMKYDLCAPNRSFHGSAFFNQHMKKPPQNAWWENSPFLQRFSLLVLSVRFLSVLSRLCIPSMHCTTGSVGLYLPDRDFIEPLHAVRPGQYPVNEPGIHTPDVCKNMAAVRCPQIPVR
jgi:hypothetical protein